jgi:4-diphosphocytidyl-2-C-methyl-D-erythritol kinase
VRLLSPAKVNCFLHIQGKRPDGFHELETLMCPVNCCDEISLQPASTIKVTVEGADLPSGPGNLAWEAAESLRQQAGLKEGVHIHIRKCIPMGGGLAGGSSNAAKVLQGCNDLWDAGLDQDQLHQLASRLGSDVNLFLEEGPCLCRGRGEIVEPVDWDEDVHFVLINPGFGVSTPWAFKTYAALATGDPKTTQDPGTWKSSFTLPSGESREFVCRNDLEPAVFSKYAWLPEAKKWLKGQPECLDALMSGSGASVFALTPDADTANALVKRMKTFFGPEALILDLVPWRKGEPTS